MLIANVEMGGERQSVRIRAGRIETIAPALAAEPGEQVVPGGGNALLPGLHDHHIHLFACAAAMESVDCGPPLTADALACRLHEAARQAAGGWVRGVGYHDEIAGPIDRAFLDACAGDTPVRVQHRSGRLWILNSAALDHLLEESSARGHRPDWAPAQFERSGARLTGRLYDGDAWLRSRVSIQRPRLDRISFLLAKRGVTGLTEVSHSNDRAAFSALLDARMDGELLQDLRVFGRDELVDVSSHPFAAVGGVKFHLHDGDLPNPDDFTRAIANAHASDRGVAVHCVTVADLVLALSCIEEAGADSRDRIEHASLIPDDLIEWLARLGVTVVTQPHFIRERGDSYLTELPAQEISWLYRAGMLMSADIAVAAGSDGPYGLTDPWKSMQAAVERRTRSGVVIGERECLSPELALSLYTGSLSAPGGAGRALARGAASRQLAPGDVADLCLLDRPWAAARKALGSVGVALTLKSGRPIWADDASRAQLGGSEAVLGQFVAPRLSVAPGSFSGPGLSAAPTPSAAQAPSAARPDSNQHVNY
jgi:predicted amidohydrolase YtcJ